MLSYVPPLETLCECLGISAANLNSDGQIKVSAAGLRLLVQAAIAGMAIDTDRYAKQNPDLTASYKAGDKVGLRHHFATRGYFEGREMPVADFDVEYYTSHNPDVAKAYLAGAITSPSDHYISTGVYEFRAPKKELESTVGAWASLAKSRKAG